jgi:hypothetical protein
MKYEILGILIIVIVGSLISGRFSFPSQDPTKLLPQTPTPDPDLFQGKNTVTVSSTIITPLSTTILPTEIPSKEDIPILTSAVHKLSPKIQYSIIHLTPEMISEGHMDTSVLYVGEQFSQQIKSEHQISTLSAKIIAINSTGLYYEMTNATTIL